MRFLAERFDLERNSFHILCLCFILFPQAAWANTRNLHTEKRGRFWLSGHRTAAIKRLERRQRDRRDSAWAQAYREGWEPQGRKGPVVYDLMAIHRGLPRVYKTCNIEAALSIGVPAIRDAAPFFLSGFNQTVGLWDGGAVLSTHQEFKDRIHAMERFRWFTLRVSEHATHIAGTIGALGVHPEGMGMAPDVRIDSYNYNRDLAEVAARAMSDPSESDGLQVSNHSYGYICGWDDSTDPPRWYGEIGDRQSYLFGLYDENAQDWDEICFQAPFYLSFRAAGNDRIDEAPAEGDRFAYYEEGRGWVNKTYDPETDPQDDGIDGNYDTLTPDAVAKNVMSVGAVRNTVHNGARTVKETKMTDFSAWGPTNDGRIKPDVVTNGVDVFSTIADDDMAYDTLSGTSMATASASGSAALLLELYQRLFPESTLRSASLKGLLIHTADDLTPPGPDYRSGWGLLNLEAAAFLLQSYHEGSDNSGIVEAVFTVRDDGRTYEVYWDGQGHLRATLCWTDPPGPIADVDNRLVPSLVNDLDLRIIGPHQATFDPYILNPARPSAPAVTGDNYRDNVEQVVVRGPAEAGAYHVRITFKKPLLEGRQDYSLVLSITP